MKIGGICPRKLLANDIIQPKKRTDEYYEFIGEANERLEIDTMKKKAVKITVHGDEINVFNDRNKDNRLYIPIPPGTNIVVWNNSFSFDIVVYDARSEPKWESDE